MVGLKAQTLTGPNLFFYEVRSILAVQAGLDPTAQPSYSLMPVTGPFLFVRRACLLQQLCNENAKQGKTKAYLLWTRTCRCWAKLLFSASFLLFVPSFSCSSCFRFLTFCLSLVPYVFFLVFVRPLSVFVFFFISRSLCSFLALVPLFLLLFYRFFFSLKLVPVYARLRLLCFSVRPLVLSVCSQPTGLPLFALVIYM